MISKEPEKLEVSQGDARRTYWLKRPVLHERAQWRSAIAASGGKHHGQVALLDLLAQGVKTLLTSETSHEILEALLAKITRQKDAVDELTKAAGTNADGATIKALSEKCAAGALDLAVVEDEVRTHWPPYAQAIGDDAAYWQIVGIEAARMFLVSWDGLGAELKHVRTGKRLIADSDCLEAIPEGDLPLIGLFAESLARVSGVERKNSSSPLATSSGGETSTSLNGATSGNASSSASSAKAGPFLN